MIRLENLIELIFSIRAFRAYYLLEVRQTVPCRAIRADNLSQQDPPPLLFLFVLYSTRDPADPRRSPSTRRPLALMIQHTIQIRIHIV